MKLEFWGVRGTAPAPGTAWGRYGGHTTCSSVRVGPGQYIVIDAGTGLRELGDWIMAEEGDGDIRIDLLLTHFHLDHIMGFPVFAPLFSSRTSLVVHSPAGAGLPSPGPAGFANTAQGGGRTGIKKHPGSWGHGDTPDYGFPVGQIDAEARVTRRAALGVNDVSVLAEQP